ncbi:MAG: dihydropteroate synthase [Dehalococcoidia bacterium]|nr:dihydropteroate synthase [Dehalococcoidia bacterium]
METKIASVTREVVIGDNRPTVLIGERINPTGKKKLAAALQAGDMELLVKEAVAQVKAGADILDVNVGVVGVDQVALLPRAVSAVMEAVDVPLCIDSDNTQALEAALKVYKGKALVNSVSGEERLLAERLPLIKEYGAAVIGLVQDDEGVPTDSERRVAIAHRIVERAEAAGIPREDVVIDCLAFAIGADTGSGITLLDTIRRIRNELGVNMTMGASNVSFGMPDRDLLNNAFIATVIVTGATCLIVDVARVRPTVLAIDLVLGRDQHARRYTQAYRERQRAQTLAA